jgi:hypothetical protein
MKCFIKPFLPPRKHKENEDGHFFFVRLRAFVSRPAGRPGMVYKNDDLFFFKQPFR